jgi:hypothetical protein
LTIQLDARMSVTGLLWIKDVAAIDAYPAGAYGRSRLAARTQTAPRDLARQSAARNSDGTCGYIL